MNEWKEYRFNEFVNVNPKVVFSKKENIAFVEMKDIDAANKFCTNSTYRNLSGGSRFENGDTLFARITPCLENGKIAQVRNLSDGKGLGSTEFHVLRGRPNISDSDFVYYLSRWNEVRDFAEINLHGTSGRQRFPAEAFKELVLNLPGITEQQSIAEVLSSLDDKIDLLHRQNKTLEQMAETLFRQWFVEEAKEDWEVKKVGEVFETSGGGTPSTSEPEYWDGDICWTSPRDLSNNKNLYLNNTERKITQKGLSKISSGILPIGTVLMSSRAPIGYLAITDTPLAINQGYIACIPNQEVSGWYIHCWIKSNMDLIISSANGSTFLEIPKREFRLIDFVVPPKPKKREFDLQSEQLYNKIKLNEQQIKNLENSREILLPKLMNGTLKLSGI